MAEYDLMPKLVGHLDRHMIFPLLEFATGQIPEDDDAKTREITKAKYELLKTTNMTDFVGNLKADLEDLEEIPAEFNDMRQKVLTRLSQFEEDTSKITDLLGREEVVNNLRSDKVANLEFLKKEHEVCKNHVSRIKKTRC